MRRFNKKTKSTTKKKSVFSCVVGMGLKNFNYSDVCVKAGTVWTVCWKIIFSVPKKTSVLKKNRRNCTTVSIYNQITAAVGIMSALLMMTMMSPNGTIGVASEGRLCKSSTIQPSANYGSGYHQTVHTQKQQSKINSAWQGAWIMPEVWGSSCPAEHEGCQY